MHASWLTFLTFLLSTCLAPKRLIRSPPCPAVRPVTAGVDPSWALESFYLEPESSRSGFGHLGGLYVESGLSLGELGLLVNHFGFLQMGYRADGYVLLKTNILQIGVAYPPSELTNPMRGIQCSFAVLSETALVFA